ncbi:DUF2017 family protein [Luethyella okanaganae]|uniref:DUF2017 family protein n=1 Tax=Luethyella okanaganae TaxID=69372 RepID=A0ABW1VDL8_9MICO
MIGVRLEADGRVLVLLEPLEVEVLEDLARQYASLLDGAPVGGDPALGRLFPDAYPDDSRASSEFSRFTRDELRATRLAGVDVVRSALAAAPRDPHSPAIEIVVDEPARWTWLRLLTELRLTLAERLGIHDDADAPDLASEAAQAVFGVYEWLGMLQESMLAAIDAEHPTRADRPPHR